MATLYKKRFTRRRRTNPRQSFWVHIVLGIVLLLCITALLYATYYVTRREAVTINTVSVIGGETISHDKVRLFAEQALQGTYTLIIPRRFSYLYPHDAVVEAIGKIARIHSVEVERTSRNELVIRFEEHLPEALWCVNQLEESSCYFITEEGYAFAEAPKLQGGALVRHISESDTEIVNGEVIDPDLLANVNLFAEKVESELHFRVASIVYKSVGDIEFNVSGGGSFFVTSSKDFATTFNNLKTVMLSDEYKHLAPGNFKYVDVRFDNKVFVNEDMSLPESEEPAEVQNEQQNKPVEATTTLETLPE